MAIILRPAAGAGATGPAGPAGVGITPTASKTSAYTAVAGDAVRVDASGGAVTITLPASAPTGTPVSVKKTDATTNAVTVVPSGSDTIDGLTSVAFKARNLARMFVKDSSTTWVAVDGLTPIGGPDNARYNRLSNTYIPNDDCLLNYRKAIARARHGGRACRVNAQGDSTTYGVISGTNPNTEVRRDYNWATRAKVLLQAGQLLPGVVEDSIMLFANVDDSRFTYSGGNFGVLTSGQTMTFADAAGHDAYDLCILRSGNAASVSVSVDGGSAQVLDLTTVTNNQAGTFRVTGTGTGTHSVVVSGPASGTAQLLNLEPITTATPPIVKLGGVGTSGETVATLAPGSTGSGTNMARILRALPDLMFLLMGVNDMRASTDLAAGAATYKTNIDAFASAFQAQGTDVVFIVFPSYNSNQVGVPSAYESVLFHQAIYDIADSRGCAVLDLQRRWGYGVTPTTGSASTPVTNSAMYDGTHPTLYGYRDLGRAVARLLADAAG